MVLSIFPAKFLGYGPSLVLGELLTAIAAVAGPSASITLDAIGNGVVAPVPLQGGEHKMRELLPWGVIAQCRTSFLGPTTARDGR